MKQTLLESILVLFYPVLSLPASGGKNLRINYAKANIAEEALSLYGINFDLSRFGAIGRLCRELVVALNFFFTLK